MASAEFLTIADAARLLRVSIPTVKRWIGEGRLPACRVGPRTVRIRRRDLETSLKPVGPRPAPTNDERTKRKEDLWAGYDADNVCEAIEETTGSWADLDVDSLIADIYSSRQAGSRPQTRP